MPGIGTLSQLGIDTATPVTKRFDFLDSNFDIDETIIDGNGLRGTLSPDISRLRMGIYHLHGPITFEPNRVELQNLLPWILGTNVSGTTYALADTAQTRYCALDFNDGDLWTGTGVAVNRATFRAEQNGPLNLELALLGQTTAASGSFPALSIDTATGPFVFTDLALTLANRKDMRAEQKPKAQVGGLLQKLKFKR